MAIAIALALHWHWRKESKMLDFGMQSVETTGHEARRDNCYLTTIRYRLKGHKGTIMAQSLIIED